MSHPGSYRHVFGKSVFSGFLLVEAMVSEDSGERVCLISIWGNVLSALFHCYHVVPMDYKVIERRSVWH